LNLENTIPRTIYFIIGFILSGAFLYTYLLQKTQKEKAADTLPRNIDALISNIVLTVINLIYLLFIFVQVSYLFNGDNNQFLAEMTYADYAREGFHQLIMVSIINFSLIAWQSNQGKIKTPIQKLMLKSQLIILTFFTLVILSSAHKRLSLYEDAYGYTYIRFFSHYVMYFLISIGAISLYKIFDFKSSLLKYSLISLLIFYTTLNYINPDIIIAQNNIDRFASHGTLDLDYFYDSLSLDAICLLEKLENDQTTIDGGNIRFFRYEPMKNRNPETQELEDFTRPMSEAINRIYRDKNKSNPNRDSWPEFNISQYKFENQLK